ncbi:hypothetical protein B0H11DRAFT_2249302 [Mycena galericulata]|nr:hypothetical protein B0H11DRAFT_2249302 [Mycena galericulata]
MYQPNITDFFSVGPPSPPGGSLSRHSPPQLQSAVHSDGAAIRHYTPGAGQATAPIDVEHWSASVPIDVDGVEDVPTLPSSPVARAPDLEVERDNGRAVSANLADVLNSDSSLEDNSVKQDDYHTRFTCCICVDTFLQPVVTLCIHIFCDRCIHRNFRESFACPQCRNLITSAPFRDHMFETDLEDAIAAGHVPQPSAARRWHAYRWNDMYFPLSL